MSPVVQEWLNLIVRWAHVIAAIMWVGDSFLFMWLDSQLRKSERDLEGEVVGELWMAHSGGFYEVVKRKSLAQLPPVLHWFKWESYATWISGFLLLIIVYYLGGTAMLTEAGSPLSHLAAVHLSLGLLVGGLLVYDLLCRTPLAKDNRVFGVVGFLLMTAVGYVILEIFSPRAGFLQMGAMLGTIMASNVFFRIIPAQKHMLAATAAGQPVDTSYGMRAKKHSTHNHYLTLPVLFTMLSNHFPGLYGHSQAWLVLALLMLAGAGVKYVMNFRARTHAVVLAGTFAALAGVAALTMPQAVAVDPRLAAMTPISFATVQSIVQSRCITCHTEHPSHPSFAAPPAGVTFDRAEYIRLYAERIMVRATQTKTMPLGNLTGMTEAERQAVGAWVAQGANLTAPGPVVIPPVMQAGMAPPVLPPDEQAKTLFGQRCMPCHGPTGGGDGPAAQALNPKPRNFHDAAWQRDTTDAVIAKAILEGGQAVGKSGLMPGNPDLAEKPEVVAELVKLLRSHSK